MRFFDSTLAVMTTNVLGLCAAFVANVLISRTLGEVGKGLITMLLYVPTLLFSISNLGAGFSAQYFVSRKEGSLRAHFTNVLFFPMVAALLVGAGFCLSYRLWQSYLNDLPLTALLPALVLLPLSMIYEPGVQLLTAAGKIVQRSLATLVYSYASLIVLALLLSRAGITAAEAFWSYIVGFLVGTALCFGLNVREYGLPFELSWSLFKRTFKYGLWIYVGNIASQFLVRIDFLFLVALRTVGEGGIYSVAVGLTSPLLLITQAVQTILFPQSSSQSEDEARSRVPFYYHQIIIVMSATAIVIAALSHPLLILFGRQFLAGQIPLFILLVTMVVRGMNGILSVYLLGRGYAYVMILTTSLALALSIVLNYLLIPHLGMIGAALATGLAYVGESVVLVILYRYLGKGSVRALFAFRLSDFSAVAKEIPNFVSRLKGRHLGGA